MFTPCTHLVLTLFFTLYAMSTPPIHPCSPGPCPPPHHVSPNLLPRSTCSSSWAVLRKQISDQVRPAQSREITLPPACNHAHLELLFAYSERLQF
ncbi:hypothetical protein BDV98DRAFT_74296 [Pterulicium gracile]|uniref:Secreted protein n=1 Tax=Pterulicium gracile TaxID=1884261 RepID=A0A5C3QI94_9AGAR|nr:hypothetical protein BDV98DRAFT_74296 [Pterula gracilis]